MLVIVLIQAYLMSTHDMMGEPKIGDRMFKLMDSNKAMIKEK